MSSTFPLSFRYAGALAAVAACGVVLSSADTAQAQDPACSSLPAPIVYGRGGSAPNQLVGRLAVEIAESSQPLTIVYKDDGACFAMESLVNGQKLAGTAKYWVRDSATNKVVAKTCTLPTNAEEQPDASWGSMAQQATTCAGIDALPADVSDQIGPISGFSLIVPNASTQQVISAEAVYYIYGLGVENTANQVAPWTVPAAIGSRTTTSAAGLLLAKAVGIPLSHTLYGTDVKNNQGAADYISTVSQAAVDNPEAAIAFCSTETADANRGAVRTLAFQAFDQEYGYWPDSTSTALDKINIRQGRYYLWNPHHIYAKLASNGGDVVDANTKRWVSYLAGTQALPDDLNWLDTQIAVGVIPQCAMQVNRDDDVGPLYSYQPDEPCGCYYETKATGQTPASCTACEASDGEEDAACPDSAKVCRHGFCEVK